MDIQFKHICTMSLSILNTSHAEDPSITLTCHPSSSKTSLISLHATFVSHKRGAHSAISPHSLRVLQTFLLSTCTFSLAMFPFSLLFSDSLTAGKFPLHWSLPVNQIYLASSHSTGLCIQHIPHTYLHMSLQRKHGLNPLYLLSHLELQSFSPCSLKERY